MAERKAYEGEREQELQEVQQAHGAALRGLQAKLDQVVEESCHVNKDLGESLYRQRQLTNKGRTPHK